METKLIRIDPQHADEEQIEAAGACIRAGGLVAFPTETVYGLGGNALDEEAAKKIYAAKGRPSDNPLIVHIAQREDLYRLVTEVPEKAEMLMDAFWPGPLTMILRKSEAVPLSTTGGLQTVAVRMPDEKTALAFLRAAEVPVAAPSANLSGRPSPTSAAHVEEDLSGRIDMILDDGPCQIGIESTIVDLTEDVPVILRPGYVTRERLEEVIGPVISDQPSGKDDDASFHPKAPGMKYRHYAPKAPMTMVTGKKENVVAKILALAQEAGREGKKAGIIATRENAASYAGLCGVSVKVIGSGKDPETIGGNLYRVLREMDEEGIEEIFSETIDADHFGEAVMNRLGKAAGQNMLQV